MNDRTIIFLVILLDKTVSVGSDSLYIKTLAFNFVLGRDMPGLGPGMISYSVAHKEPFSPFLNAGKDGQKGVRRLRYSSSRLYLAEGASSRNLRPSL